MADTQDQRSQPKKGERKRSFGADVLTIAGGTTIAEFIAILTVPIITRIYGASMFGLSATFASIVTTIVTVSSLRYEFTIMLPDRDEKAVNLLAAALIINSVACLCLVPIFLIFGNDFSNMLNAPNLAEYLWLVPVVVFLTGTFNAVNYWNSRQRKFRRLSTAQVAKASTIAAGQLGFGYAGFVSGGSLIASNAMGQALATTTLTSLVWKEDKKLLRGSVNRKVMKEQMIEYKVFPKFDLWSGLINVFSLQLPIFILGPYFGQDVVGWYSVGLMVLQMPATFIGQAISKVFYQRAAEAYHVGMDRLSAIAEQVAKRLILIGTFPILLLSVVGPDLFLVVLGEKMAEAGVYAQILSFWILIVFVSSPLNSLLNVMKKVKAMLMFNIALIGIRAATLIFGGEQGDVYLSLILFSVFGGIAWLFYLAWILKKAQVSLPHLLRSVSKYVPLATALLAVVIVCRYVLGLEPLLMVVVSVVVALVYYAIYALTDKEFKSMIMGMLGKGTKRSS